MRRRLSFAVAALALAAPLVGAATINGCSDPEFESICLWVSDPNNCYRKFRKDAVEAGNTCKPIGNPTPVGADPANPLGVSNGSFVSRGALDVCFMAGGGSVVIDPPIDLANYPPPLLSTPIAYKMTFLDDTGAECGSATYTSPHGFSFTINPPPDAGASADGGTADAGADAGDAGPPMPYGTFTQVIPAGGDAFDSTCPTGETHHFNLVEVTGSNIDSVNGNSAAQRNCPKFEQLVPRADFVVNPGGIETPGAVSFTIYWPKVDNDAAYQKDNTNGVLIQTGTPLVPDAVTYFNCSIGGAPRTCQNGAKDPNETDIDCGGTEISPNCPARCGDGQLCVTDCDCDDSLVCLVSAGVRMCGAYTVTTGTGGAMPTTPPPRDCSAVIICKNGKQDGAESDVDCGGPDCNKCPDGNTCATDTDCLNGYCLSGVCATAACDDGVKNQGEADIDCGGPCMNKCPDGNTCTMNTDCASGNCFNGICDTPDCTDNIKGGNETDVDCGGGCPPCALGLGCMVVADCTSNACINGVCVTAKCTDGQMNGTETDVDCGSTCQQCVDGQGCLGPADCVSGVCDPNPMSPTGNTCYPVACNNMTKDGNETDVDCGGGCAPCGDGLTCATNADCFNGLCSGGVCFGAQCSDMVKNGAETDVDCGGAMCPKCGLGLICGGDSDCATLNCNTSNICTQASCTNTKTDGLETDLNCGGGACPKCATGLQCKAGSDCVTGVCTSGICQAATCSDMVKNGAEADVDCGAACPTKCGAGLQCMSSADCAAGVCAANNTCTAALCNDGVQNGTETAVDCGGACPKCGFQKVCVLNTDCISNSCVGGLCQAGCTDMVQNGGETAVDCGGFTTCPRCAPGLTCTQNSDCVGNSCALGVCAATCNDMVKNGNETDIDCGGSCTTKCGNGQLCSIGADCSSGVCTPGAPSTCAAPTCVDGVQNGNETATDCGGSCPTKCAAGQGCTQNSDCASGTCDTTVTPAVCL